MSEPSDRETQQRHGTLSTYNRGCHCDLCRRANADYQSDYMQRMPVQQLLHAARKRRAYWSDPSKERARKRRAYWRDREQTGS